MKSTWPQHLHGPLLTVILDGVGESDHSVGNAVKAAYMPFFNGLKTRSPFRTLRAHGTAVGLPSDDDMGNSEVGHNALGAGQIFDQGAKLVQNALADGTLFQGSGWRDIMNFCHGHGTLHWLGLLSDGNVHSHLHHLERMMTRAFKDGQKRQRLHLLLDGRDVGETSALIYVARIEGLIAELNAQGADIAIASGGGRMVLTMDRYEADWGMVASGWKHHVLGEGRRFKSAEEAIETYRAEGGFIDQFLPGFVIANDRGPLGKITDGDSVVLFNFRGDRAIEISRAFTEATLNTFDRGPLPHLCFAGMMEYDGDLKLPPRFLVGPPAIANTLGECLADRHIPQFAISETQKFGHVTYFWNGNRSGKFDENSETYLEIPSDQIPFETRPWMKCGEITDALIRELSAQPQRFFRVNFPNGDMVGHTGDFNATRIAMESLDIQLKRLLGVVEKLGGIALITADHGNADEMFELDKKGNPKEVGGKPKAKTSHTLAPVPFLFFDPHHQIAKRLSHDPDAGLANIAATITDILHLPPHPDWMRSLLTPP